MNDFIATIPQGSPFKNSAIDYKTIGASIAKMFIENKGGLTDSAKIKFSDKQISYIDTLKVVLKDQKGPDSILIFSKVSKLEKEIWESNITDDDKYRTLMVTAVGKYSWKYWSNYDRFKTKNMPSDLIDKLIEADIEGAMAGALIGCITGAVEGTILMPGVGSLTGCIIQCVVDAFEGGVVGSLVGMFCYFAF